MRDNRSTVAPLFHSRQPTVKYTGGRRGLKSLPIPRDLAHPLSIKPEIDYVRANRIFIRATPCLRANSPSPGGTPHNFPLE